MPLFTTTFTIDSNHPSLPGHFPEQPVVPGVVLLSHMQAAMQDVAPEFIWAKIIKAKFENSAPIGETMALTINVTDLKARLICTYGEACIVSARVTLTRAPGK